MREGICSICGSYVKLSKEHMPPKRAFNECTVLLKKIDKESTDREVRWKKFQRQGGSFEFVLCSGCNNRTGGWYGRAYVDFVKQCAIYAHQGNGGKQLSISVNINPLRVLKQVLSIMCASCGSSLAENFPILRQLILHKTYRQKPANLRLWLYLLAHTGGRRTGRAAVGNITTRKTHIVAEFSWWPIGWVLSFTDNEFPYLADVTDWYLYDYYDRRSIVLNLNCNWATTAFPLDYRDPDTVEKEASKHK